MITGGKRKVAQVGDHQKYSSEILQPAVSVFVANKCIFRQPYVWWVCVKSGDSYGGTGLQLQPQPLMSCGVGMGFFTQTPPRNVLFMKVSLLCDRSSFDGPH